MLRHDGVYFPKGKKCFHLHEINLNCKQQSCFEDEQIKLLRLTREDCALRSNTLPQMKYSAVNIGHQPDTIPFMIRHK